MPPSALLSLPPSAVWVRGAALEAALVAGGILSGVVGAAATRDSLSDVPGDSGQPLWATGGDSLGKMAAYMAIGSVPMVAPLALAAALTPPTLIAKHPARAIVGGNLALLGAYPAALAIGFAGLEKRSPPHAPLVASLVGTVIVIGMQVGIGFALYGVLACAYLNPSMRERMPQPLREWLAKSDEQDVHADLLVAQAENAALRARYARQAHEFKREPVVR